MRLMLVEDDPMVGKYACKGFERAGFTVDWLRDGAGVEEAVKGESYGAVVLDLGLPSRDGMDVLRRLRASSVDVPVLVLTARDALGDRVAGLEAGADDYVLKPFDMAEVVARIHALVRRYTGRLSSTLVAGRLVVDPLRKTVLVDGTAVAVSAREFSVLEALAARPGAVLSRQALEKAVYGWDEEVTSNAIEVHLHNLRRKLGTDLIENIRGVGYRIVDR
jgi:two-component system response regulator QseB